MNYQEAKKIREKSYMAYLTEKLSEGRGVGSAIKSTLSEKSRARSMGYKEKFDPLNVVKFMTGGSKFATALYGSMSGRTQQDIQYFAGTKKAKEVGGTATRIGQLESDNQVLDVLSKIYSFLKTTNENNTLRMEREGNTQEEKELEREKRHKELIAAITGKKQTGSTAVPTATKADDGSGLISTILGMVTGLIGDAIKGVMSVISGITSFISMITSALGGGGIASIGKLLVGLGRFLVFNPVGIAIVAGTGIAYAIWKILKNPDSFEDPNGENAKGLRNAEKVGGLAGVKDEMDRRKKIPEYDRTVLEIKDYEKSYNEGQKLNNKQLEGFANRGPGALEAVEDYKLERDRVQQVINSINQTATPVTPTPQTTEPTEKPTMSGQDSSPALMNQISGAASKLNTVTSENLELNLPSTPEAVTTAQITNNMNVNSVREQKPKGPIPSVRNMEDSFQRMLLSSLRVV